MTRFAIGRDFVDRVQRDEPMSRHTSWHVGGPADAWFSPRDVADLSEFLRTLPAEVPVTWVGLGSNLLVRDGGIRGVVISVHGILNSLERVGETQVRAEAGVPCARLGRQCAKWQLGPADFFAGIPGTVGGAAVMNAGCYGSETVQVLTAVNVMDRSGDLRCIENAELHYTYRHSALQDANLIVLSAEFEGTPGDPEAIKARMAEITERREQTQPIREKTGGSTFKNPDGNSSWKLVDGAGWRGKPYGGAMFSPLHANFLINTGEATAADLEGLGEEVRRRVFEMSGVTLQWEIKRVGRMAGGLA